MYPAPDAQRVAAFELIVADLHERAAEPEVVDSRLVPTVQIGLELRVYADEAVVVVATIEHGPHRGRGECVPYPRYGESPEGVLAAVSALAPEVAEGLDRAALATLLPAGAARRAQVDSEYFKSDPPGNLRIVLRASPADQPNFPGFSRDQISRRDPDFVENFVVIFA